MDWYWIVLIVFCSYILLNIIVSLILCKIAIIRDNFFHIPKTYSLPEEFKTEDPLTYKEEMKSFTTSGELISHKMRDGRTMYARIYKKTSATKTIILYHGFRACPEITYYNAYSWLKEQNLNLVFIYSRAHSMSEGRLITMGYKEKEDLHEWYDFVSKKFNTDIYLWGTSMGCATALLSLDKPYSNNLKGIVADCGYCNVFTEYYFIFKRYCGHVLSFVVINFLALWIFLIAHINIFKLKTYKVINKTNVPILFVHGDKDKFVSPKNTYKNYNTYNGPKDLLIIKNAPHARNMYYGGDEYIQKVKKLLNI